MRKKLIILVKKEGFVTNVDLLSTLTKIAHNSNTNLHYAFIVELKDTLQENVKKIKKVYIGKEGLASDADQFDTY